MIRSSSTWRLTLADSVRTEVRVPRAGDLVVAEVLSVNPAYPNLELPDGSFHPLATGDRVVGVLGSRRALRGFVGEVPETLAHGDTLALLNMGGVVGRFLDSTSSLGAPAAVRYLGTVVDEEGTVSLDRAALAPSARIDRERPVVLVVGTCMNVGKTSTIAKLIEVATASGHRVGAAKLAGVAAIRDLREFERAGAVDVRSFIDCGLPSTVDTSTLAPVTRTILNALEGDLAVVELGDGIMGHYRVETVLTDSEIMSHVAAVVLCAGDITGAYGAKVYLDTLGVGIDAVSGLATENISGSSFIEELLGIPAINAIKEPHRLFAALPLAREVVGA